MRDVRGVGSLYPGFGADPSQVVSSAVASGGQAAGASLLGGILSGALTAGVGFGASYGISQLVGFFTRRGRRKEEATQVVDEAEVYLKQNLRLFQEGEVGAEEAASNFNNVWNYVVTMCKRVGGSPGERCISERERGGRYDWFAWYLDPILESVKEEKEEVVGEGMGIDMGLVAGVGLLAVGLVVGMGGGK